MSNRRFICAVLLSGLCGLPAGLLAAGKCERLVATGNPQSPPYLWRDPLHADLLQGGTIEFKMGSHPNLNRGINDDDAPYSFSKMK